MTQAQQLFDLSGRVALITGSGAGFGVVFAEAGHDAIAVRADVSDEASVAETVEKTVKHFGRIDIFVNNAGVATMGGRRRYHQTTGSMWSM